MLNVTTCAKLVRGTQRRAARSGAQGVCTHESFPSFTSLIRALYVGIGDEREADERGERVDGHRLVQLRLTEGVLQQEAFASERGERAETSEHDECRRMTVSGSPFARHHMRNHRLSCAYG